MDTLFHYGSEVKVSELQKSRFLQFKLADIMIIQVYIDSLVLITIISVTWLI